MTATGGPPLVIVSGMSGSGKSVALKTFEDLGYYCVDNLPAELLPEFVRRMLASQASTDRIAVGIDARSLGDLSDVPEALSQIGAQGMDTRLLFFDTRDEVLLRRYADTRRRHPLSHLGLVLPDAISLERQALKPLRQIADHLDADPEVIAYVGQVQGFLDAWLPKLRSETRSYVTVAFGCSGGRHRSVYLAERLARHCRETGWAEVAVHHRELD